MTVLGQVYFRTGVTLLNPEGTKWEHVAIKKGLEACQVTVAANGTPFVVSWTGSCLYRMGLTPHALSGESLNGCSSHQVFHRNALCDRRVCPCVYLSVCFRDNSRMSRRTMMKLCTIIVYV